MAGALAASVAGSGADVGGPGGGPVVLYAGHERLDPQRAALGEPPLIDGAVLSSRARAPPRHTACRTAPPACASSPALTPAGCICCTAARSASAARPTPTCPSTTPMSPGCTAP
ncbi:hypothetical protein O1L68_25960 [Streptomyces lydicus]|nr:hypothetical protein [Streptomyces lydicus]